MLETSFSLSELNRQVADAIHAQLPESYWLRAETSDVRPNRNGHCYLEFVEKDATGHSIIAKARGIIWSNTFQILAPYFESETGHPFTSGLNVLVRVSVDFHELYGYSLTVLDIDPSFTMGEMVRHRQRVLKQLEHEGVLTLNKELSMPELPHRIAVISSPTAAGYEDFKDHLYNNAFGFVFYTCLFPAVMQGERSEVSIVEALEKVFQYRHLFDAVALIRGGGATSDLSCFDAYLPAAHVAQFPLPVISGIGHERDDTVLDAVAHTRVKTPTAVAAFFIDAVARTAARLSDLQNRIISQVEAVMVHEKSDIFSLSRELHHHSSLLLQRETAQIDHLPVTLRLLSQQMITNQLVEVEQRFEKLKRMLSLQLQEERHFLQHTDQLVRMVSPEQVLKRGYTLTLKNGKIIKSVCRLSAGDRIETRFADGIIESAITS